MAQIIHPDDTGVVGESILETIAENEPVDAETFALAILMYRRKDLAVRREHMEYTHRLMRVMLDSLLAREQVVAQKIQFWATVILGISALILAAAALR
jgi:hypothetical protein